MLLRTMIAEHAPEAAPPEPRDAHNATDTGAPSAKHLSAALHLEEAWLHSNGFALRQWRQTQWPGWARPPVQRAVCPAGGRSPMRPPGGSKGPGHPPRSPGRISRQLGSWHGSEQPALATAPKDPPSPLAPPGAATPAAAGAAHVAAAQDRGRGQWRARAAAAAARRPGVPARGTARRARPRGGGRRRGAAGQSWLVEGALRAA